MNEWMNEWMIEWIGRTEKNLKECAAEIKARGGNPVIVQMDHGNDAGLNSKLLFSSNKFPFSHFHQYLKNIDL